MKLHPAILKKETIEKFGYDPSTLALLSMHKVVAKCPDCWKIRITTPIMLNRGKEGRKGSGRCKSCHYDYMHTSNTIKLTKENYTEPTVPELINCFYSGSVSSSRRGTLLATEAMENSCKRRVIKTIRLLSLCKLVNLNPEDSLDTSKFKGSIQDYLLGLNKVELFKITNHILKFHRKLRIDAHGNANVNDALGLLPKLFDRLGVKYEKKNKGRIAIFEGSFYVEGRWIHVDFPGKVYSECQ